MGKHICQVLIYRPRAIRNWKVLDDCGTIWLKNKLMALGRTIYRTTLLSATSWEHNGKRCLTTENSAVVIYTSLRVYITYIMYNIILLISYANLVFIFHNTK